MMLHGFIILPVEIMPTNIVDWLKQSLQNVKPLRVGLIPKYVLYPTAVFSSITREYHTVVTISTWAKDYHPAY